MIPLQQPPEGAGVGLDPVGAADHQNGAVQHLKRPLRLGGEVHMARRVQQGDLRVRQGKHRLLGEDGDAPLPLHGVRVQKGVLVVHPAQAPQGAALVQQRLGQCGLPRVHMGQYSNDQLSHVSTPSFVFIRVYHIISRRRAQDAVRGVFLALPISPC